MAKGKQGRVGDRYPQSLHGNAQKYPGLMWPLEMVPLETAMEEAVPRPQQPRAFCPLKHDGAATSGVEWLFVRMASKL